MKRLISTLGALVLLASAAGCATILAPKTTQVSFDSAPPGADVYVDGARVGSTPTVAGLSNSAPHVAKVQKAGYKESSCHFAPSVGVGWLVLDVVLGVVPVIVDAATGSWYSVTPTTCAPQLTPEAGGTAAAPATD